MNADDLQHRIIRGTAWAFASSWLRLAVSLIAFAIIARIIGPASYGLNAGAGALAALCQVLVGPAAGEVLVQGRKQDTRVVAAYFWLLLGSGLLIALALVASHAAVAQVYDGAGLMPVLLLYALTIPLAALQTVPEAELSREMQFRPQAYASGAGVIVGSILGIGLALKGAGLWSLAVLQLAQALIQVTVLWFVSGWRPAPSPDWRGLPPLLRYSSSSLGVRLLNELDNQLPKLFVGAILGVVALGYYSMARRIFDLLKDMLIVPLNMVALPSIASAHARGEDLPRLFGNALRLSTFIANPAFLGLLAIAPLLIPVLFGPGWEPAVPALQLMALLGLRTAVNSFNGAALRGLGKPLQQVGVAALGVGLLCIIVPWAAKEFGLMAAIAAVVIRAYATWPLSALLVERLGVFPARRQFSVGLRSLAAALLMAMAVWSLGQVLQEHLPALAALLVAMGVGVLLYAVLTYLSAPGDFRDGLRSFRLIVQGKRGKAVVAAATA